MFEGGAAFTSAPEVRIAVTNLCGVRRVKTGSVTVLLEKVYDTNPGMKPHKDEKQNDLKLLNHNEEKMQRRESSSILR